MTPPRRVVWPCERGVYTLLVLRPRRRHLGPESERRRHHPALLRCTRGCCIAWPWPPAGLELWLPALLRRVSLGDFTRVLMHPRRDGRALLWAVMQGSS